ncbi:MAG: ABC-2 family transporter protein [Synechococcaceae cyanobacterium]|nr:ABC-2 family transporter protein [Synechococcaceae cyanobacterium]
MGRYGKALGRFWAAALAAEMEYPLNFLVELLAVVGNLAGSLFVVSLFYGGGTAGGPAAGAGLGGWSWEAALVVLGVHTLMDGFASTLLHPNLSRIVSHVQNGTLDFVLLQPIDSQFWLSLRTFSPWGLPGILAGLGLIGWAAGRAGTPADPAILLPAALMLLAGAVLLYSLWFVLAATSIWFVKVWNATEVLRSLMAAGRFPIGAYPAPLRVVFTFVLPVAFLTTVPAQAILGRASSAWLGAGLAVAAAALLASRAFWRFALRHYTSASS